MGLRRSTPILVQGITGREASSFVAESLAYGANIAAGVTPGKGGRRVHGVPVYNSVVEALAHHPLHATVISVPARFVRDAAAEALAAGLKLMVIVTERIPRRDVVAILEQAEEVGCQIIGPNSLGLIVPGQTRLGMAGGSADAVRRAYMPGPVAVLSRSGGMTTEIASMLTARGIGQSIAISVGGDPIVGSTFADLIPVLAGDGRTRAAVLFCEPGGSMEEDLAAWILDHGLPFPIIAFIAGKFAERFPGQRFGHAAAIVEGERGNPRRKAALMQEAGITLAATLADIPPLVQEALAAAAE
ncbi:MAG: succinate--CoA ligase subunit alpha [Caldilineae bacterium]|nr:MAG: succinate--CoA ligase subunit alpha [Caldilineae bacterium]